MSSGQRTVGRFITRQPVARLLQDYLRPPPPATAAAAGGPGGHGVRTGGELLCLDVGARRTGVAVSSFATGVALPVTILRQPARSGGEAGGGGGRGGGNEDAINRPASIDDRVLALHGHVAELDGLVEAHGVVGLVVGWPLELDGSVGAQCRRVRSYVNRMQRAAALAAQLRTGGATGKQQDPRESCRDFSPFARLDTFVWDERYTSQAVEPGRMDRKRKRKYRRTSRPGPFKPDNSKRDAPSDDLAAAFILQGVMNAYRREDEDAQIRAQFPNVKW